MTCARAELGELRRMRSANRQLRIETVIRNLPIIGSTVAVLLAWDHYCGYLWAGDSRIYLWRGERLRLLTGDHRYAEEVRSRRDPNAEWTQHCRCTIPRPPQRT